MIVAYYIPAMAVSVRVVIDSAAAVEQSSTIVSLSLSFSVSLSRAFGDFRAGRTIQRILCRAVGGAGSRFRRVFTNTARIVASSIISRVKHIIVAREL